MPPYNIARYSAEDEPRWPVWLILFSLMVTATMVVGGVVVGLLWLFGAFSE